jgi:hypothetical protein
VPYGLGLANETDIRKRLGVSPILAKAFHLWNRRQEKEGLEVFAVSLQDIKKALKAKTYTNPKTKLPPHY